MTNRLAAETSPYLLQHAGNPVDWFPWGEEALARARETDRPILLSIGYSACHWCHVMEHESFEDAATAGAMNEAFVNVKVDREERPDLDSIYMKAVQAMTGQGGWPLTVFLTPDGIPYYGGTYFPPEPRHGMPSFRQVLAAAANAYHTRRDDVVRAGTELTRMLDRSSSDAYPGTASLDEGAETLFGNAVGFAARTFDPTFGGFGGAPKFPQPVFLDFLLRSGSDLEPSGVAMAVHTLTRMAHGGIRDHLAGGFHRYSVDARWLVPHFEKMLYDNALLARALTAAHVRGARHLGPVAEETLDYVLADLTSDEGAFFSARDADSEGEEGAFYLWTPAQVEEVLDSDTARLFSRAYDVSDAGNFEGRNILHLPHDLDAIARQEGITRQELDGALSRSRAALEGHRRVREHPIRDEKILTVWNGFTIRALAEAGPALGRPDFTEAAVRGATHVLGAAWTGERLSRVMAAGRVHIDGFLEDYGAMGNACLSLYEATLDPGWLESAGHLAHAMVDRFWDEGEGLFYDAAADAEELLIRPRDIMDNATPSGNSLAAELLARAHRMTGFEPHGDIARRTVNREMGALEQMPTAMGRLLTAGVIAHTPPLEITVVGSGPEVGPLLARAHRHPHPNRVIVGGDPGHRAVAALPALQGRLEHAGMAFVCSGATCLEPVKGVEALDAQLTSLQPVSF